jgi:hypothetical protein
MGPGYCDQGFTCTNCNAPVSLVSRAGGTLLAYFAPGVCEVSEDGFRQVPPAYLTYVNDTLLKTWRVRSDAMKAHENKEWETWVAQEFKPQWPDLDYPSGKLSYYDLPDDARAAIDAVFGGTNEVRKVGNYLTIPEGLQKPVVPPQVPQAVHDGTWVFLSRIESGWERLDPAATVDLPIPRDPLIVRNEEFWNDVFTQVEQAIEQPFPERAETPNGYSNRPNAEPWYTFTLAGTEFRVGWRKRVTSLTLTFPQPKAVGDIHALADRDSVTYSAKSAPRDFIIADEIEKESEREMLTRLYESGVIPDYDRLPDDAPEALSVTIHAWGKDKTIEYLTQMCRTAIMEAA